MTRSMTQMPAANIEVTTDTITAPTLQEQRRVYYRHQQGLVVTGEREDNVLTA